MKAYLQIAFVALVVAIDNSPAQNRTAIVTGGGTPPPANGAVIVAGGTPAVTPPPIANTNVNSAAAVAGQALPGGAPAPGTPLLPNIPAQTNDPANLRATNSVEHSPQPNTPRNLLPRINQ